MIAEFQNWGAQFKIEFSITVTKTPSGTANIFHFTGTDKKCCKDGDRIPSMYINSKGQFETRTSVNGQWDYGKDFDFELNHVYQITIQQLKDSSGLYWYEIIIDGVSKEKTENKQVKTYPSVKLYTSDPWDDSFTSDLGLISNLNIQQIEGLLYINIYVVFSILKFYE